MAVERYQPINLRVETSFMVESNKTHPFGGTFHSPRLFFHFVREPPKKEKSQFNAAIRNSCQHGSMKSVAACAGGCVCVGLYSTGYTSLPRKKLAWTSPIKVKTWNSFITDSIAYATISWVQFSAILLPLHERTFFSKRSMSFCSWEAIDSPLTFFGCSTRLQLRSCHLQSPTRARVSNFD